MFFAHSKQDYLSVRAGEMFVDSGPCLHLNTFLSFVVLHGTVVHTILCLDHTLCPFTNGEGAVLINKQFCHKCFQNVVQKTLHLLSVCAFSTAFIDVSLYLNYT